MCTGEWRQNKDLKCLLLPWVQKNTEEILSSKILMYGNVDNIQFDGTDTLLETRGLSFFET